jgi:2-polyprenyl-6-methoxyphenol hydroxylase-like FAD-dependent oxidoreductase
VGKTGEHAVVLGGSIGGLLAATVLADAYNQVTVIDRDSSRQSVSTVAASHRDGIFTDCCQAAQESWRNCSPGCWRSSRLVGRRS